MRTERAGRLLWMITLTAVMILLTVCLPIHAQAATCTIKINGETIQSDAAPIIENNTTLVPIAVIADYLGGTSSWEQSTKTATIKNGDTTVALTIGSKTASVNGEKKTLTVAPKLVTVNQHGGARTMVPLRFVAEAFEYDVSWDGTTRTAMIDTKTPKISRTVTGLKVLTGQTQSGSMKYTLVKIVSDESLKAADCKGVMLSDPYRYYVDIPESDMKSSVTDKSLSVDKSYVSKIRVGGQENIVRIVCDLKGNVSPSVSYSDDGKTMILAFPETYAKTEEPEQNGKEDEGNGENGEGSEGGENEENNGEGDEPEEPEEPVIPYEPYADGKLVVCIDPGHGKTTAGKRSPDESLMEWEFNRDVAYRLKDLLEKQGIECIMTVAKDDKTDPSLASRVNIANSAGDVDLYVSVHANAFDSDWNSVSGWEVYVFAKGTDAEKAAKSVEAATKASSAGLKNRGVKTSDFYVLKYTSMPAILIEHGFYTNPEEVEKLKSSSFRQTVAQADATGIVNFFKLYKTS